MYWISQGKFFALQTTLEQTTSCQRRERERREKGRGKNGRKQYGHLTSQDLLDRSDLLGIPEISVVEQQSNAGVLHVVMLHTLSA